ncbi:MAG: beta-propeller fold lactonase family protein [Solirubrobacteraceae bacterium]|nr:beta-propeller fold lactonase family protein [Solirubrobacteraceae bacterium]
MFLSPLTALRRSLRRCAPAMLAAGGLALLIGAPNAVSAPVLAGPAGGSGCVSALPLTGCTVLGSLDGAVATAISPDGRQAYVAARDASAITILDRGSDGRLTATSCLATTPTAGCTVVRGVASLASISISPDGRLVATASPYDQGVAIFLRDPATGSLNQPAGTAGCATETGSGGLCLDGRALGGAQDVAFSADGTRLFVAAWSAHAVSALRVDAAGGIVSQPAGAAGCFSETGTGGLCGDGRSLMGVTSVAAVGSGGVLATTNVSNSLVRLTVDPATGAMAEPSGALGCVRDAGISSCPDVRGLNGAADVAVTPDGGTAIVAAASSDAVSTISLGASMSQPSCISETGLAGDCIDARALDGAARIAVSPDGQVVYAAAPASGALSVLDLAGTTLSQSTGTSGCASDRGIGTCTAIVGLGGVRGVAVDTAGRLVTAADTSDAAVALRPAHAPACTDTTAAGTWDHDIVVPVPCADPDGDPITIRVTSVPRGSDVRTEGSQLRIVPTAGTEATLRIGFVASDGALTSGTGTATVRITAPPPKPPPGLPAELSGPLLGVERRAVNPDHATTSLPTFCLPRRTTSCSGTVELRGGSHALGQTPATGPGEVVLTISAAARRALRRADHADAIASAAGTNPFAIELPVRRPRAGMRRIGTQRAERLRGGRADDRLSGRGSNDRLVGLGGDDQLVGGGGNDRLDGGAGLDDLSGNFGNDRLDGAAGDDTLRGASGDDRLFGGGDADRLDGGTGNDTLEGGPGDDALDGFDGDDKLRGGPGHDYLVESRFGDDKLLDGGPGDDYVDGNRGNDTLVRGGEGNDIVLGGPGSDSVDGGPGNDVVDGGAGEDPAISGGSGNDVLVGGRGNDTLEGGPGDDMLYGSTGADHFDCGSGEDWIYVDSTTEAKKAKGCEHVIDDDPTRDGAYDPVALVANRGLARGGVLALKRGSALGDTPRSDRPIGTHDDDELLGTDKRDLINGNDGNDLITGGAGNDDLDGGDDDDELRGGTGNDRLFGRFGADDIHGEEGNDELEGGRGEDTLDGGSGNDKLNGGFDPDVLRGGPGTDRIIAVGGGIDDVDCGPGQDRADVDRRDIVKNCEDVRRH